jgi:hypothetical protein
VSSSSQNPRPAPKPTGLGRDEAKARVLAKIEAERALPASKRIANMLHAVHTTADAQEVLNRFRAEVLREAEGIAVEIFDAANERGDRAAANIAEQIADRLEREAREAEGGAR